MAKSIIQVAPDSTGKKLDTRDITGQGAGGTDLVQRQVVVNGDGTTGNNLQTVDAFARAMVYTDGGRVTISDAVDGNKNAYVSEFGRLRVGMDTLLFYDAFDGTALNYNLWTSAATTHTIVQANSFLRLNDAGVTTINTNSRIESHKDFLYLGMFPLYTQFKFKTPNIPQSNVVMEIGFLEATGASTPTQGAFMRYTSNVGFFDLVVNTGGSEVSTFVTIPTINNVHTGEILVQNRKATYWVDGVLMATVAFPATVPTAWTNQTCPFGARVYITGTAAGTAPQLSISEVSVAMVDIQAGREYAEQLAIGMARSAWQKPVFATDWGQTASWANAAAPTAAALTNTTIPQTWQGGMGGDLAYVVPLAASANTDLIVFAYQVPAGRTLVVRRINISQLTVTTALVAGGTPIQAFWFAGFGCSAVSLATAESPPTSWAPRRIGLGVQSIAAAAAVGTMTSPAADITMDLSGGVGVVESGRYLHIGFKPLGSVAAQTGVLRGTCTIIGTFE